MFKYKYNTFSGGYKFVNFQGQPSSRLEELSAPSFALIPLRQGFGSQGDCLVRPGDRVEAGQVIGSSEQAVSSPVHATIGGVVEEVKQVNYFKRDCVMVSIRGGGEQDIQKIPGARSDWQKLTGKEIEKILYLSGVTALDREGIPTSMRSSIILPEEAENLIIHGCGAEPYNISHNVLLREKNLLDFVEGIAILRKVMPKCRVYLVLNRQYKKNSLEEIYKLTAKYGWLEIYLLDSKYPQGYDEMLVSAILKKKFPYGYSAANIGTVILNFQAVLLAYNAVTGGLPFIERVIALCGPAFREPLHIKARIGTPLKDIVSGRIKPGVIPRFVLNGLLTGPELKDLSLPIDKTYSQIIAIAENKEREFLAFARLGFKSDSYSRAFLAKFIPRGEKSCGTNLHGEERPCINCGYCEDVCPVRILPHLLSKYIRAGIIDETLMNLRVFNCIECGLCSYLCPSKIPLARHIKEGQEKLTISGCDRNQCILPYFDNLKGVEGYRGAREL